MVIASALALLVVASTPAPSVKEQLASFLSGDLEPGGLVQRPADVLRTETWRGRLNGKFAERKVRLSAGEFVQVSARSQDFAQKLLVTAPSGATLDAWGIEQVTLRWKVAETGAWIVRLERDGGKARGAYDGALEHLSSDGAARAERRARALELANELDRTPDEKLSLEQNLERQQAILTLHEAAEGAMGNGVAVALQNLGAAYENLRDYPAARRLYERALAVYEKRFGPDVLGAADAAGHLAAVLHNLGDSEAALPYAERALKIVEAAVDGREDPRITPEVRMLAAVRLENGDVAGARSLYEREVRLCEAGGEGYLQELATALRQVATIADEQGHPDEALRLFERALAVVEKAPKAQTELQRQLGRVHAVDVAAALNDLGVHHLRQGTLEAALPLLQRAVKIAEESGPEQQARAASLMHNLAYVHERRGELELARGVLQRALAKEEAAFGPEHPELSSELLGLARLLRRMGKPGEAQPLLLRAARITDAFVARNLPSLAFAEQRAFVAREIDPQISALLSADTTGADFAATYRLFAGWKGLLQHELSRQARVSSLSNDPNHAADVAALQSLRSRIAAAFLEHTPAEALTRQKETLERRLAEALPPGSLEDPWRALGEGGLRARLPGGSAFADVYRYERVTDAGAVNLRYAAVVSAAGTEPVRVELGEADAIERDIAAWRDAVVRGEAATTETPRLAETVWAPIARALPRGTARLWISPDAQLARINWAMVAGAQPMTGLEQVTEVASPRALAARIVSAASPGGAAAGRATPAASATQDGPAVGAATTGAAPASGAIAGPATTAAAAPNGATAGPATPSAVPRNGPAVGAATTAAAAPSGATAGAATPSAAPPNGPAVGAATTAAAAPSGATAGAGTPNAATPSGAAVGATTPGAAMPNGTSVGGATPAAASSSGATAGAVTPSATTPNGAAVGATTNGGASPSGGAASLLLVGDVDFGTASGARANWPRLPGTRTEVNAIGELATERKLAQTVLTGAAPTPTRVLEALSKSRYAHLATHGFFAHDQDTVTASRGAAVLDTDLDAGGPAARATRNPLVESGLVLAGANRSSDGTLTAEQLIGADLRQVSLMVLSACETGRGTEVTGQGVLGLRASLEAAGVHTVLMSLWKVPDESTALLMKTFYRGLWTEGLAPAVALRRAQETVRADPRFTAPVHWAAWVLSGD